MYCVMSVTFYWYRVCDKHDLTHRYRDTVGIYCFSNVHITLRNELRMDANKFLYQSHAELCFGLRIHTICRWVQGCNQCITHIIKLKTMTKKYVHYAERCEHIFMKYAGCSILALACRIFSYSSRGNSCLLPSLPKNGCIDFQEIFRVGRLSGK